MASPVGTREGSAGFPRRSKLTAIPSLLFGRLLEEIDDLAEMKCTLRLVWMLQNNRGCSALRDHRRDHGRPRPAEWGRRGGTRLRRGSPQGPGVGGAARDGAHRPAETRQRGIPSLRHQLGGGAEGLRRDDGRGGLRGNARHRPPFPRPFARTSSAFTKTISACSTPSSPRS